MAEKLKITLDMDDLTFGDMELFEDVTGLVMSDAVRTEVVIDPKTKMPVPDPEDPKGRPLKETKMSARAMMGLVFLSLRKENPEITFEEVKNIKMSDVDFGVVEGDEGKDESEPDTTSEKNENED